jgi:hypothetical protein
VPSDEARWKPHPKSAALGHLTQLVCRMPRVMSDIVKGIDLDLAAGPGYSFETTEVLLGEFDANVTHVQATLAGAKDSDFDGVWNVRAGEDIYHSRRQMRARPPVALVLLMLLETHSVGAAVPIQDPDPASAMGQLRAAFDRAAPPRLGDLRGEWVLVRHVSTERFLTGGDGPDHLLFDPVGIRREVRNGTRREWTVTFACRGNQTCHAKSDTVWEPTGDASPVDVSTEGDALFEKQYGGDARWIYRCRAASATELLCLLRGHENGHGVVFRKPEKPTNGK